MESMSVPFGSVFLRRSKPHRWWQMPEFEYEKVVVIGIGTRHKGSYAGNSWDYRDVLIENTKGQQEEVRSSEIYWTKHELLDP